MTRRLLFAIWLAALTACASATLPSSHSEDAIRNAGMMLAANRTTVPEVAVESCGSPSGSLQRIDRPPTRCVSQVGQALSGRNDRCVYWMAFAALTQRKPTASSLAVAPNLCLEALVNFEYESFQDPLRITTAPSASGLEFGP